METFPATDDSLAFWQALLVDRREGMGGNGFQRLDLAYRMSGKWLWGEAAILGHLRVALMAPGALGPESGKIHYVPSFAVLLPLFIGIVPELHHARAKRDSRHKRYSRCRP